MGIREVAVASKTSYRIRWCIYSSNLHEIKVASDSISKASVDVKRILNRK